MVVGFVAMACADALVRNSIIYAHDFMDDTIDVWRRNPLPKLKITSNASMDKLVDKLAGKLLDKLVSSVLNEWPLCNSYVDSTTLFKTHQRMIYHTPCSKASVSLFHSPFSARHYPNPYPFLVSHSQVPVPRLCVPRAEGDIPNIQNVWMQRKQAKIKASVEKVGGIEGMQKIIEDTPPVSPPLRLANAIAESSLSGRTAVIVELRSPAPHDGGKAITAAAQRWESIGATAFGVATDAYYTPLGEEDLGSVVRATKLPVIRLDWVLHPLQMLDTVRVAACGVNLILQVLKANVMPLVKFGGPEGPCKGMDMIFECVNTQDVKIAEACGAVLFGINLSVGLKLASIPGAKEQTMKSLLGSLPQGVFSVVGVKSIDEIRFAKSAGADAIFLKHDALENDPQLAERRPEEVMDMISGILSGDD